MHSHICSIPKDCLEEFQQPCLGSGPIIQTINNLKAAANMLNFLTVNGIKDMAELEERVEGMYGEQRSISEKLKPIDRRLKTLDEHISNAEKYFQYRDIFKNSNSRSPKSRKRFTKATAWN